MIRTALFALLAGAAAAQTPLGSEATRQGNGAVLRGLDKLSGDVVDMELSVGETVAFGRVQVSLGECRYPAENPSGDAFAWVIVRNAGVAEPRFDGWMVASSPALNALDHPRYDVWLMRCTRS